MGGRSLARQGSANGGGLTSVKGPRKSLQPDKDTTDTELYQSGRWQEIKYPIGKTRSYLTVANYYGCSGANNDIKTRTENEILLAPAIQRAIEANKEPYILVGDCNIDPSESPAIAAAVEAGLLVDVAYAAAPNCENASETDEPRKKLQATFCQDGASESMSGSGTTRIDVVLANPTAAAAITDFRYEWDKVFLDHVPLSVTMSLEAFEDQVVHQKGCEQMEVDNLPNIDGRSADDIYYDVWAQYGDDFEEAINAERLDDGHKIWCEAAEAWL